MIRIAVALALPGVVLLIVVSLIETDADRIEALVEEMRTAALRQDVDGVLAGLSEDASLEGQDPRAFRAMVRRIERDPLRKLEVSLDGIEVDGDRASATALVLVEVEGWPRPLPRKVRVGFVRRDGRWLVKSADRQ